MLTNLWYVAERLKVVKLKPVKAKLPGQNPVACRGNSGTANSRFASEWRDGYRAYYALQTGFHKVSVYE